MSRPWQIWLFFTLCLLAVVPAMLWVTSKAFELDQAEYAARLQAEQEEVVSRALWMIDSRLGPMLAEEAARPDFVFRSLGENVALANVGTSNYLAIAPNHVLLHFELKANGQATSPQIPLAIGKQTVEQEDASCPYRERLANLLTSVSYAGLHDQLPTQSLPQLTLLANNDYANPLQTPVVVTNGGIDDALAAAQTTGYPNSGNDAQQQLPNPQPSQQANPPPPQQVKNIESPYGNYAPNSPDYNTRKGKDLQQRNNTYNTIVARRIVDQRQQLEQELGQQSPGAQQQAEQPATPTVARKPIAIREGISGPVWIDGKLLFARRVQRGDEAVIQGCWLDWEALKRELLAEVAEILPAADLLPLTAGEEPRLGRLLATLPHMQLVVAPPDGTPPLWSPIRMALAAAWGCLAFAALASGWLLLGVVTLSERRASFVSAVTHELRTPLTTFRMYAEMLAADMVTSPEQKQKYLETLCVEADRLTHLVDNVLLYARLERSRSPGKNRISLPVGEMLERYASRLANRAEQSGMKLVLDCDDATARTALVTDPSAVEQIVFNLVDNASKYASRTGFQPVSCEDRLETCPTTIILSAELRGRWIEISVRDFGPGLSDSARRRLFQPFSKTSEEAAVSAPGVGLGLALCKRLAADLGGQLELGDATPGTQFVLKLPR